MGHAGGRRGEVFFPKIAVLVVLALGCGLYFLYLLLLQSRDERVATIFKGFCVLKKENKFYDDLVFQCCTTTASSTAYILPPELQRHLGLLSK